MSLAHLAIHGRRYCRTMAHGGIVDHLLLLGVGGKLGFQKGLPEAVGRARKDGVGDELEESCEVQRERSLVGVRQRVSWQPESSQSVIRWEGNDVHRPDRHVSAVPGRWPAGSMPLPAASTSP